MKKKSNELKYGKEIIEILPVKNCKLSELHSSLWKCFTEMIDSAQITGSELCTD